MQGEKSCKLRFQGSGPGHVDLKQAFNDLRRTGTRRVFSLAAQHPTINA